MWLRELRRVLDLGDVKVVNHRVVAGAGLASMSERVIEFVPVQRADHSIGSGRARGFDRVSGAPASPHLRSRNGPIPLAKTARTSTYRALRPPARVDSIATDSRFPVADGFHGDTPAIIRPVRPSSRRQSHSQVFVLSTHQRGHLACIKVGNASEFALWYLRSPGRPAPVCVRRAD